MKEMTDSAKMLLAFSATQRGETLAHLAGCGPTLLVFLRHIRCVFNRQILGGLAKARHDIEQCGITPVIVHMATDRQADLLLRQYGLQDLLRVSDESKNLYRAFGLRRATMAEILNAEVVKRGLEICVKERRAFSITRGDPLQMPGWFLVDGDCIMASYIPKDPWETPDYAKITEPVITHLAML